MIKTNAHRFAAARLPDFPASFPCLVSWERAGATIVTLRSPPLNVANQREGGRCLTPFRIRPLARSDLLSFKVSKLENFNGSKVLTLNQREIFAFPIFQL